MRWLWIGILLAPLCWSDGAEAVNLGRTPEEKAPGVDYDGGGRVGGDTIEDAVVIQAIPFSDAGNTCGYTDDYDEFCPFGGSTSPDVVYSFAPLDPVTVSIDLCASLYDTKVYVYQDEFFNMIACNDDAGCGYTGYQSRIDEVEFLPGSVYYIVVDGYGGYCGQYVLEITFAEPCDVVCPPEAVPEGEPPCEDDYFDDYNWGCQVSGWTEINAQIGDCGLICGRGCTFLHNGLTYRDTDWYSASALGGEVTGTCVAEYPVLLILMYGASCYDLQFVFDTASPCEEAALSWNMTADAEVWFWVAPSVFEEVPEGEYLLEVCGIQDGSSQGACCAYGFCYVTTEVGCAMPGFTWWGLGTDCDPDPCLQPPSGACCLADGSCELLNPLECLQVQGTWMGEGTECDPNPCPPVPTNATTWGRLKDRYR